MLLYLFLNHLWKENTQETYGELKKKVVHRSRKKKKNGSKNEYLTELIYNQDRIIFEICNLTSFSFENLCFDKIYFEIKQINAQ